MAFINIVVVRNRFEIKNFGGRIKAVAILTKTLAIQPI